MSIWRHVVGLTALVILFPLVSGQGCGTATTPSAGGSGDDLTTQEKKALVVAANAPGSLSQATSISQNSTGDLSGSSGQPKPTEGGGLGDISFGTCPNVSKTGTLQGEGGLTLGIDFGSEPCTALVTEDYTYQCSGSASGTFSLTQQSVSLTFNSIQCNDFKLDGTADLGYGLSSGKVELNGSWDLYWYPGTEIPLITKGSGKGSYTWSSESCCDITAIETFTGTVDDDGYVYSLSISELLISFEKYYAFMPYSGTIVIDGPETRALTITFDENSPTTGNVTVSIEKGRTITVNVYELDEWEAMFPEEAT